ncbi:BTAD domain-containing putative transcriptional regulator [Nocardiopsis coralli]|uniref:BTAD domain-containing putative transcriptional regulator n=1 Tax=Nocardiopsis coralli TaxID=2772213 RepID=UPI002E2BCD61|nr:BTAD domain-containing putative transcriptional regulator [Nocardiopsis coralli]
MSLGGRAEPRVRVGLLGRLTVETGGEPLLLRGNKRRALLAALLLRVGRTVPAGVLATRMWGHEAAGTDRRGALQVHVARLRALFTEQLGTPLVLGDDGGYRVELRDEDCDLLRLRSLVRAAREAGRRGDRTGCADLFARALELWRGPVLVDVPGQVLHEEDVAPLTEELLGAAEEGCAAALAHGDHERVAVRIRDISADHPEREPLVRMRMRALHRSGRRDEALRVYERTRAALAARRGAEPGDELCSVYRAVLLDDAGAGTGPGAGAWRRGVDGVAARREPGAVTGAAGAAGAAHRSGGGTAGGRSDAGAPGASESDVGGSPPVPRPREPGVRGEPGAPGVLPGHGDHVDHEGHTCHAGHGQHAECAGHAGHTCQEGTGCPGRAVPERSGAPGGPGVAGAHVGPEGPSPSPGGPAHTNPVSEGPTDPAGRAGASSGAEGGRRPVPAQAHAGPSVAGPGAPSSEGADHAHACAGGAACRGECAPEGPTAHGRGPEPGVDATPPGVQAHGHAPAQEQGAAAASTPRGNAQAPGSGPVPASGAAHGRGPGPAPVARGATHGHGQAVEPHAGDAPAAGPAQRQDPTPRGGLVRLPEPRAPKVPAELPAPPGPVVGRNAALIELDRLADPYGARPRPVLLRGPLGTDASALALHWAHSVLDAFPDGQLYVDLREADRAPRRTIDVQRCLLRALVPDPSAHRPRDTVEGAALLRSALAGRRVLVLIDHARSADQVRPLLPGAGCAVLVVSRIRLTDLMAFEGFRTVSIGPLGDGDAVRVLADLLGRGPDPELELLAGICDGLPLVLRMAAAWLRANPEQTVPELVRRVGEVDPARARTPVARMASVLNAGPVANRRDRGEVPTAPGPPEQSVRLASYVRLSPR